MGVSLAHGQLVLMQVPQVTRSRNAAQDGLAFSGSLGMGASGLTLRLSCRGRLQRH
jgi:hypothetical protein